MMLSVTRGAARQLDRVFAALANDKRRRIVRSLGLQPASISELAKQLRSSLPAIHRHIRVLEQAKLIRRRKSGRVNFLALDRTGLLVIQEWIAQYHPYWGTNAETLENYLAAIENRDR
jgi:DNA-binding transcriptional ArsR family regulator